MKLSLGPILYYWDPEAVRAFYRAAAGWPVDIVYLGEVVCSKRRALKVDDWLAIADELAAAGKEVVLSTLALIEAESELLTLRRIAENGRYTVEANDMAAVQRVAGTPFVAGPHLNCYNPGSLALMAEAGARRWVMPVELDRETLDALQRERPAGLETEVFAFGRIPLAFSARCFTARAHRLPKDDCRLLCGEYADGLSLDSQDGEAFLTVNGIQTQSAATCNLVGAVPELSALGVDVLRLSPQSRGMQQVVQAFRSAIDGEAPEAAQAAVADLAAGQPCNGFFYGRAGMDWVAPANAEPQL